MATSKKLVILGMDGLDPHLLERYMQQGLLPHFKKLSLAGSNLHMKTSNPPQSPVAWSNFISGSNPGKHDVFDFIVRDASTYMPEIGMTENEKSGGLKQMFAGLTGPAVVTRRKGAAFWDLLGEKGIKSTIVRLPVTFPAQKLEGRLLTGMGTPDIRGTQGIFSFFSTVDHTQDKDLHGRMVHVTWEDDTIKTQLTGPRVKSINNAEDKVIPLTIRKKSDSVIALTVGNETRDLKVGDWSDWYEITFKMEFFQSISGLVRFHLNAIAPEFELYASPVNIDPKNPAMQISYPPDYASEMCDHVGLYHTQGMPYDTWALNEGRLTEEEFLNQAYFIFDENMKMLRFELSRFQSGVLFNYFGITDLVQHMFWRYEDPQHPNKGKNPDPRVRNAIRDVYVKMDEVLGEVEEKLGPDTALIVMSDHGFGSFRRAVHINSWLRDNGFLVLQGDDTEGKELFSNVDWSQTRAYSLGFGGIYINQQGREKKGIVYKGAETEDVKKEIIEKLSAWKDTDGAQIVKKVYTSQEIYSGPYAADAPDLFVGFNLPYRASWQTGLGASPKTLIEDNMKMWGGDHLCDPSLVPGVLMTNLKWKSHEAGLIDLFPTILSYFGVSPQEKTEGHIIQ